MLKCMELHGAANNEKLLAFLLIYLTGDARLQTAVGEFTNIGSVSGQVSQLYLCDVLARGYEQKTDIDTDKLKERALQAVIKKSI